MDFALATFSRTILREMNKGEDVCDQYEHIACFAWDFLYIIYLVFYISYNHSVVGLTE